MSFPTCERVQFRLMLAPVCRHVRLVGPSVNFVNERWPSTVGGFFSQLESDLTHRESSRSVSLSLFFFLGGVGGGEEGEGKGRGGFFFGGGGKGVLGF